MRGQERRAGAVLRWLLLGLIGGTSAAGCGKPAVQGPREQRLDAAIWSLPVRTLEGQPSSLGAHRGKALLVVNVASRCGLTPQYAVLERLQKEYGARGFTVLGFPCNQFKGQEPGSPEEIRQFCSLNYGITFPLFEKIEVNGPGRHPIYAQLARIADASGAAGDVQWNFEKFVIARDGQRVWRFRPKTQPDAPEVLAAIDAALAPPG
jgi:glutathione peroxidase